MFTKFGPFEAVIHFAAYKHVGESQSKPLEYYENNLTGSINLLKAMRKHNVKRLSRFFFGFSSSQFSLLPAQFMETLPAPSTRIRLLDM